MWEIIRKKAIEHIAVVIIGGLVSLITLAAFAGWAFLKVWIYETSFDISRPQLMKTIELASGASPTTTGASIGVSLSAGMCHLSMFSGRFDAYAERVAVYPQNGEWVYDFRHGAAKIKARIDCYSHPQLIRH